MQQKHYYWSGINQSGRRESGVIIALNQKNARELLLQQHITPIKVKKRIAINPLLERKITQKSLINMIKQLSTLFNANIPIISAFRIIEQSSNNAQIKKLINGIVLDLESGHTISQAFRNRPKLFDALFCNLISVGEHSGTLDLMLKQLIKYKERIIDLKRKVKKALFYPAIIIFVATIVTSILLIFVIPQFAKLFSDFGAILPAFTLLIISIAKAMHDHWYLLVLIPVISTWTLKFTIGHFASCAEIADALLLRLPVVGKIVQKAILARLLTSFAITYKAGIPLNEILTIISKLAQNRIYAKELRKVRNQVTSGQTLTSTLTNQNLFPMRLQQMIAIGEESGTLEFMLGKAAEYYETEVDQHVDSLNNLLEPLIIVILGTVIGGLLVGMYLPIFKLGTVI